MLHYHVNATWRETRRMQEGNGKEESKKDGGKGRWEVKVGKEGKGRQEGDEKRECVAKARRREGKAKRKLNIHRLHRSKHSAYFCIFAESVELNSVYLAEVGICNFNLH